MSKDLELKQDSFPLITELTLNESVKDLITYLPEHKEMIKVIETGLPEIQRATSLFYKTQTQFMDNMLTLNQLTPLRLLRQILAEMTKAKGALKEVQIKCMREETQLKMKFRDLEEEEDPLKADLLKIDILELSSRLEDTKGYISGALRKVTNYQVQYDSVKQKFGIGDFTEADVEAEEPIYHIGRAFDQALRAARTRGGIIDEGNMIYLSDIGINGAAAQNDILQYLNFENNLLKEGKDPTNEMYLDFLRQVCAKYSGCPERLASYKGLTGTVTEVATIKKGDTRLLK